MNKHLAVIFSDWHIHDYKRFNVDGQRLSNCLRVLDDIGSFCSRNGIRTIFFAGDLYDQHKALLTNVVNETVEAFLTFEKRYPDITIYAITGNHDQSTKNLIGSPATSALKHIESICKRFIIVDDDTIQHSDGWSVSGIPYYEYSEHFKSRLSDTANRIQTEVPKGIKQYLLIHQTPDGLGNEMIPTDTNPKDIDYMQFDHVFCGHIHTHKKITDTFTLVGNPIHRDLADAGLHKGFLVMNLLKPEKGFKFIRLKGYPEFVRAFEDDEVPNEEGNYVVRQPKLDTTDLKEKANVEEFNTSLGAVELITNFCNEVADKADREELLAIGLEFVG